MSTRTRLASVVGLAWIMGFAVGWSAPAMAQQVDGEQLAALVASNYYQLTNQPVGSAAAMYSVQIGGEDAGMLALTWRPDDLSLAFTAREDKFEPATALVCQTGKFALTAALAIPIPKRPAKTSVLGEHSRILFERAQSDDYDGWTVTDKGVISNRGQGYNLDGAFHKVSYLYKSAEPNAELAGGKRLVTAVDYIHTGGGINEQIMLKLSYFKRKGVVFIDRMDAECYPKGEASKTVLSMKLQGVKFEAPGAVAEDPGRRPGDAPPPTTAAEALDRFTKTQYTYWGSGITAFQCSYSVDLDGHDLGKFLVSWKGGRRLDVSVRYQGGGEAGVKELRAAAGLALNTLFWNSTMIPLENQGARFERLDSGYMLVYRDDKQTYNYVFDAGGRLRKRSTERDGKTTLSTTYPADKMQSVLEKTRVVPGGFEDVSDTLSHKGTITWGVVEQTPVPESAQVIQIITMDNEPTRGIYKLKLLSAKFERGTPADETTPAVTGRTTPPADTPVKPADDEPIADKRIIGSWHGSFLVRAEMFTEDVTFNADGTLRSVVRNGRGMILLNRRGTYTYRDNILDVSYPAERTTPCELVFINDNSYVLTVDKALKITYRRQR